MVFGGIFSSTRQAIKKPVVEKARTLYISGQTRHTVNINWMNSVLPPEVKKGLIEAEIANLELFKVVCENNPA